MLDSSSFVEDFWWILGVGTSRSGQNSCLHTLRHMQEAPPVQATTTIPSTSIHKYSPIHHPRPRGDPVGRARHHDAIDPPMTTNQHCPLARVPVNRYAPPLVRGHPTAEPHGASPGALLPRGNSGPASDVGSSGHCAYQFPRAGRVLEASSR